MKGTVSAQKAFQGSETETWELLGGTEEKCFPNEGSLICPPVQSMIFFTKRNGNKNELVAGPAVGVHCPNVVQPDFTAWVGASYTAIFTL